MDGSSNQKLTVSDLVSRMKQSLAPEVLALLHAYSRGAKPLCMSMTAAMWSELADITVESVTTWIGGTPEDVAGDQAKFQIMIYNRFRPYA